jgi:AcrR family transcriptional regulator
MARWEPNAEDRLRQAALDLYGERGYEQTTVAAIAKKAGLTERTFFRYFADKPEVLFSGSEAFVQSVVAAVADAPAAAAPIEVVGSALEGTASLFNQIRDFAVKRYAVIEANSELRQRELIKMAALASAIADTLRGRGVNEPAATLTAEAGVAAFKIAFQRWVTDPGRPDLAPLVQDSMEQLKAVTAGVVVKGRRPLPTRHAVSVGRSAS